MVSEIELLEVFRLGEAARDTDIVHDVGDQLGDLWLGMSQFRDVQTLTARSLRIQSSPDTLRLAGQAKDGIGNAAAALGYYEQALPIFRKLGDRHGEAATLNNIGKVHARGGDSYAALDNYEQVLPVIREVGDRYGEAVTLHNIGMVHSRRGDSYAALDYYKQVLPIISERQRWRGHIRY